MNINNIVMWVILQNNAGLDFQDSDFAGYLEDSKSTSGGPLCVFVKSYICSNELDVQERSFSFTQFNRIRNHFFGCRIADSEIRRGWNEVAACASHVRESPIPMAMTRK